MAINFDNLPETGFQLIPEGIYKARIKSVKHTPASAQYVEQIAVSIEVLNDDGSVKGSYIEYLKESEKSLVLYKLRRFITALKIEIAGNQTLYNLSKVIPVRGELIMEMEIYNYTSNGNEKSVNQANAIAHEIFWTPEEWEYCLGIRRESYPNQVTTATQTAKEADVVPADNATVAPVQFADGEGPQTTDPKPPATQNTRF